MTSLAELLLESTENAADEPFLVPPDASALTYADVWERAGAIAGALHGRGARPGDRVVAQVDKSVDNVALYLACVLSGLVFTPVNPVATAAELDYVIDDADPAVVVTDRPAETEIDRPVLTFDSGAAVLADHTERRFHTVDRDPTDLAALLYTSGTTGRPKGAMLTNANLVANARALVDAWSWRDDDVLIHGLPLFHVHGLFVALHCAMLGGSPVILLPRFDAEAVLAAMPAATVFMGVPTHYVRLLADPGLDRRRCGSMRLFTSGSAPMTETVHAAFTQRTGHRIVERYGMTETGILTSNPYSGECVPGTVGFALNGVELRITDDDGADVSAGTTGSVEVNGPDVFAGYWQRPDATAESTRQDGWFVTGDVGRLEPDGRLRLEGRSGDMVISGGENIYPREIELILDQIEGIAESAVIGLPDEDLGERVVAVLVADGESPTEGAIRATLGDRLARFKHPRALVWVDELPRNTMGKVQKHRLRDQLS